MARREIWTLSVFFLCWLLAQNRILLIINQTIFHIAALMTCKVYIDGLNEIVNTFNKYSIQQYFSKVKIPKIMYYEVQV